MGYYLIRCLFLMAMFLCGMMLQGQTEEEEWHGYPIIRLAEIDREKLELKKLACDRGVYWHEEEKAFYKIWDNDYARIDTFKLALMNRFYDDIAPPFSLILNENSMIVGYRINLFRRIEKYLNIYLNKHDITIQLDKMCKNQKCISLCEKIFDRMNATRIYYLDFVHFNIVQDEFRYYIIDLDAVFTANEIQELLNHNPGNYFTIFESNPKNYSQFVLDQYIRDLVDEEKDAADSDSHSSLN